MRHVSRIALGVPAFTLFPTGRRASIVPVETADWNHNIHYHAIEPQAHDARMGLAPPADVVTSTEDS